MEKGGLLVLILILCSGIIVSADKRSGNVNHRVKVKYGVEGTDHSDPKVILVTVRKYAGTGQTTPIRFTKTSKCVISEDVVKIPLSYDKYPASSKHIKLAWDAGAPMVWHIDKPNAAANRAKSFKGIKSNSKLARDEVPMASSSEGGAGADIAYIPFSDNRGSDLSIGRALSKYCNGQAYRIVISSAD